MKKSSHATLVSSPQSINLVCFDGKNTKQIVAFQKFFTTHDMPMLVNNTTETECLYHVVLGSSKEVKKIFSRSKKCAFRRLILLQEETTKDAEELAKIFDARVAVIGNRLLEQDDSRVLFGFLCGNTGSVIDMRHKENKELPERQSSLWSDDAQRIAEMIKTVYEEKKQQRVNSVPVKKTIRFFFVCAFGLLISHVLSFIFSILFLMTSYLTIKHMTVANAAISVSRLFHQFTELTFQPLTIIPISSIHSYERLLLVIKNSQEITREILSLKQEIQTPLFFDPEQKELYGFYSKIEQLKIRLNHIHTKINVVYADLASFSIFQPKIKNTILKIIHDANKNVETLSRLTTIYPLIAPPGETRTFLLLFQNSMELRPTGGFIGSVGKAVMKNGVLDSLTIEDVYTYDGQLRGHVDPPEPIKTLLQQEHWYLRDSNWDPDFEKSGQRAAWFFEKSGGEPVDGVIAISLPFVKDLLSVVGPITVPEHNEPITHNNLFSVVYKTVEKNFFPGSTQKKDMLGSISRALIEKIKHADINYLDLSFAITKALKNKNIQIVSFYPNILEYLRVYEWTGSMNFPDSKDFLFVVEANLGVNKANAGVTRKISKTITIYDNYRITEDKIIFHNNSGIDDIGGGNYTNYLRIYYPKNTEVLSVSIDDNSINLLKRGEKRIPYAEILQETSKAVTVGVAHDVKIGTSSTVTITHKQQKSQKETHEVFFRIQGGITNLPLEIKVIMLNKKRISVLSDLLHQVGDFVANSKWFSYTTVLEQDTGFTLVLENP